MNQLIKYQSCLRFIIGDSALAGSIHLIECHNIIIDDDGYSMEQPEDSSKKLKAASIVVLTLEYIQLNAQSPVQRQSLWHLG